MPKTHSPSPSPQSDLRWILLLLIFPVALWLWNLPSMPDLQPTSHSLPLKKTTQSTLEKKTAPLAHRKNIAKPSFERKKLSRKITRENQQLRKKNLKKTPKPSPQTTLKSAQKLAQRTPKKPIPRKSRPRANPKKSTVKIADLFYPLPFDFPFKKREQLYRKLFRQADAMTLQRRGRQFSQLFFDTNLSLVMGTQRPQGSLRLEAIRYLRRKNLLKFRLLIFKLLHQFEKKVDRYLKNKGPLKTRLSPRSPHYKRSLELIKYAALYADLFRRIGVKKTGAPLNPLQRYWLRIFFIGRLIKLVRGEYPLPVLLGPEIYRDYLRAIITWSRDRNLRIWAVRELARRKKNFAYYRVLGWLLVQLGQVNMGYNYLLTAAKDHHDLVAKKLLDKFPKKPS